MVLRMAGPYRRPGSSVWWFRKRIPANVLQATRGKSLYLPIGSEKRRVSISPKAVEVVCSLHTHDKSEARSRHTAVSSALESQWQAFREGPKLLSHRDAVALAGEAYKLWMGFFEDNPVNAEIWQREAAVCRTILEEDSKPPLKRWGGVVPQIGKAPTGEERFGFLADQVLADHSLVLSSPDRMRFIQEIVKAIAGSSTRTTFR